jgi:hypothetical protein
MSEAWAIRLAAISVALCPSFVLASYSETARTISLHRLESHVKRFSLETRLGTPSESLERYIVGPDGLGSIGEVIKETYPLTFPNPHAVAELRSGREKFRIYPLWPNGVRTSSCQVSGNLIYAGDGTLAKFDGLNVRNAIVLLDFSSGQNWRNAAKLGARAVLFLEPETASRADGEEKWSMLPLNMPRFWIPRQSAEKVLSLVGTEVHIDSNQEWLSVNAANYWTVIQGSDPQMRNEFILVSAYVDAVSIVPGLAPGAEQACGAAALFEIGHAMKRLGTKRSVILLLTSGHFQAMQGIRHFIEYRFRDNWKATGGSPPQFAFTLDLSSKHTGIAAQGYGWWVEYRGENVENERAVARYLRERMPGIAAALRLPTEELFADAISNPDGRHWKNHVPGRYAAQAEIFNLASINALTFITSEDSRLIQDTPFDTWDKVHYGNLATQARTIACLLLHAVNDSSDESIRDAPVAPYRGGSNPRRMSLMSGFATISGRVLTFDPRRSFLPDTPVPGSLVTMPSKYRSYMGVRGLTVTHAEGSNARFSFFGVPPVTNYIPALRSEVFVLAYKLNDVGAIHYAVDYTSQLDFTTSFKVTTAYRETPIIVFECEQIDFYGLVDSHTLRPLRNFMVLDARSDSWPRQGFFDVDMSERRLESYTEDALVYFSLPETRIKLLAFSPTGDIRLLLSNSSANNPTGSGYLPTDVSGPLHQRGAPTVFPNLILQSAIDVYAINEWRLTSLRKYNIVNSGLDRLQRLAKEDIELSRAALGNQNYSSSEKHAFAAAGFALQAHPKVLAETKDVLNGLLFYLALLLPFAYFAERLVFHAKKLSHQIICASSIFLSSFGLLRLLHPAFDLTGQTVMIFVAFTMGALSLLVMVFVTGKFESGLHKLQQAQDGAHLEKAARVGVALTALSIGLGSMRRRKARTALTCVTLVLVTFIVLSFTSVVSDLRFNQGDAPGVPRYTGILLRDKTFEPLDDASFRKLSAEFFGEGVVARRVWFFGAEIGAQSVLSLRSGQRRADITAAVGMDSQEANILRPQESLLPGGRWFYDTERAVAILPQSVAEKLDIRPEDVGTATVTFGGTDHVVIGIARDVDLNNIVDLDDESMMPANFTQSQQLRQQGQGGDEAFRNFVRLDASQTIIVPAQSLIALGADIRSIAVGFPTQEATTVAMNRIMPRVGLNLYASADGKFGQEIRRFSTVAASQSRGVELVVIPLLMAAVIVLNTMIASVIERRREIGIFSAVGLAPKQIAALFLAESLVYAVIGSFSGYLLAQVFATVSHTTGWFAGLSLNYGSLSAVLATLLVVAIVLLSAIYPANIAKKIATPAGSEDWNVSLPDGDTWNVTLPFTVSKSHAGGLAKFYGHWFSGFQDHGVGDLVTADIEHGANNEDFFAKARCWLAPFDLGIQQEFEIRFRPTDIPNIYEISLEIQRISGDPEHWETLNKRFFQSLRKQFLIWRTLTNEQKAPYLFPVHAQ